MKPSSPRRAFLDAFNSGIRPYLLNFADRLMEGDAEIHVAMARKAVCLIDAMHDVGLLGLSGVVTSDRVLDMNLEWLDGRKVTLVDDILVSGTTLKLTKERLAEAGADVHTTVLCTNKEYWQPELITPDEPHISLEDRPSLVLCTEIVNAISLVPRPYNVDWPLIDGLRIPRNREYLLGALSGWEAFDTTTTLQREFGVSSTTHAAPPSALRELVHSLGVDVSGTGIAKIRVYARQGGPRGSTRIRIVPIVSLDGMNYSAIDRTFESMARPTERTRQQFCSAASRLRLIQFVAAARLGEAWLEQMKQACDIGVPHRLDERQLGYIFPPPVVAEVLELCAGDTPKPMEALTIESHSRSVMTPETPARDIFDHWSLQQALAQPFLDLFQEKELPARRLLKSQGASALVAPELRSLMGRLQTGYSFQELLDAIQPGPGPLDASRALSVFLDSAIDHGVAVPITIDDGHSVFRAYRHGEDVEFSEVEPRLFGLMLQAFCESANTAEIPKLVVEKLCVLFLKVGVANGTLNRWSGRLGEGGSVGVRYALKGAVVERASSSLFEYNPHNGLPEMLEHKGILVRAKSGKLGVGQISGTAPTSPQAEADAIKLGALFGRLLSDSNNRISQNELTLLATCLHEHELVPALAAEIAIAERSVHKFLTLCRSKAAHHEPKECEVATRRTVYWEAVHSGQWKFSRQRDGSIWDIVKRVEDGFEDPLYKQEWRQYWSDTHRDDMDNSVPQLRDLGNEAGRWLVAQCILSQIACIALLFRSEGSANSPRAHKRLAGVLENVNLLRRYAGVHRNPKVAVFAESVAAKLAAGTFDSDEAISECQTRIRELIDYAPSLLDRARAICNPFGQPRAIVSFHCALVVRVDARTMSSPVRADLEQVTRQQVRLASARGVRLDSIPDAQTYLEDAFVIVGAGDGAGRRLGMLAAEMLVALYDRHAVSIQGIAGLAPHTMLFSGDGSGSYYGDGFWALLRDAASSKSVPATPLSCFFAQPDDGSSGMLAAVEKRLLERGLLAEQRSFNTAGDSSGEQLVGLAIVPTSRRQVDADIGIITIVTEETQAVLQWMANNDCFSEYIDETTNRGYASCAVAAPSRLVQVVQTQAVVQGTQSVINAYHALRAQCHPRIMVLLGIGGGIHRDVKLGDVVLASQVVYYDRRAETEDGVRHRGESSPIPARIMYSINRFFVQQDRDGIAAAVGDPTKHGTERNSGYSVHLGPLGCGDAVLKYRNGETRRWLHDVNEKTLVVETEAHGVATAFYEDQETRGYVVVRGISDHADEDKDDSWRSRACVNAVDTLGSLVPHLVPVLGASESGIREDAVRDHST